MAQKLLLFVLLLVRLFFVNITTVVLHLQVYLEQVCFGMNIQSESYFGVIIYGVGFVYPRVLTDYRYVTFVYDTLVKNVFLCVAIFFTN